MRARSHSFTLVEILVALVIISVIAGSLVLGIGRSIQSVRARTSKERLERLFQQAFRFSSVSGHISDVIITKGPNGWEGALSLWENTASDTLLFARSCHSISQLSGTETICLNDLEFHGAIFRFFGGHGLSHIEAFDASGRTTYASDLQTIEDNLADRQPEVTITLRPSNHSTVSEQVSMDPYLKTVPHPLPFPNEFLQAT